ncbi:MAG: amidohydrolase [Gammaproteobacteria bacterium]|jgi:aminobenzoyl-glutamate utilization protein B|uniref:Amidohydrolase n=1 Tax=SAR86 cluster bacterium TaxID=2030880 RepID=A0A520MX38_9GAMM|nr:amidohydrolase [Gammaproteobacteria bacterium]RZO25788.1 MAG: amidohydrolase [SAR86 cluster bacterium]|tara:strand:+ start:6989 stop:8377 length:1389 start_codon:yes stop_codon:yes gene_type:complete
MRFLIFFLSFHLFTDVSDYIEQTKPKYDQLALDLWEFAEMGYLETRSANAIKDILRNEGFSIKDKVAGIPTAFIAEYNNGGPIIGVLAEFDALPGLSQSTNPYRDSLGGDAGHACGHHLFGAASVHAAVAVKDWLKKNNQKGTIRLYGTPAEEGGSGKVYIARDGFFDDVDIVLHWHPSDINKSHFSSSNGNKSARFTFKGISAHAAGAPQNGRSALDGVEAMNMMVNLMREHMDEEARIHYVITKGGLAPNVVPEEAQVYYYVRHPNVDGVVDLFERVVKAARGAAQGTETKLEYEVMHGNYPLMPNKVLSEMIYEELLELGGIKYTNEETEYANELYKTLINPSRKIGSQEEIQPLRLSAGKGSTDVGDVSWKVPTSGVRIATWVPGTSSHSWQAVAAGGTTIGTKGANLAAKALANSAIKLFENPKIIELAWDEHLGRVGDHEYQALLGDRQPPLDYRK